jgi:hypothetical protein
VDCNSDWRCRQWIIAIFAVWDKLKGFFLAPKLVIERNGFSGTTATHQNNQGARYYFVRVENRFRQIVGAHEVQVVLTRIEQAGAAGPEIILMKPCPWRGNDRNIISILRAPSARLNWQVSSSSKRMVYLGLRLL